MLSTDCKYCTASAAFYRRLVAEQTTNTALIVVAPQSTYEIREYLLSLRISVDNVRQSPLSSINVKATASLVLLDSRDVVIDSWQGQLPPSQEDNVIARIK